MRREECTASWTGRRSFTLNKPAVERLANSHTGSDTQPYVFLAQVYRQGVSVVDAGEGARPSSDRTTQRNGTQRSLTPLRQSERT